MGKPQYKSVSNASMPLPYSNKKTPEKNMQQGIEKRNVSHGASIITLIGVFEKTCENHPLSNMIFFTFFLTRTALTWSSAQKSFKCSKEKLCQKLFTENVAF